MIIVQMSGGLGNQMFQYALYKQLVAMGKTVRMDDVSCYQDAGSRPKQIGIFPILYERASKEELIALTDASMKLQDRIRRKLTGRKTKSYPEKQFHYDPAVLQLEDAYLEGCWQSEKYFMDVKDVLRDEFIFPEPEDAMNKKFLEQIKETNAIGVHIRRGDYLLPKYSSLYEGICTEDYYKRAIALMKEMQPDCHFFIFSNDVTWAKEQYQEPEYTAIDCNDEANGHYDMMLLSRCRHQIIANSSFSWWSAWLNPNPEKKVIAPAKWLNHKDSRDIYTDWMLAI